MRVAVGEMHQLSIRPHGHDGGMASVVVRAEDVAAEDDAVIHFDRHVPFDHHAGLPLDPVLRHRRLPPLSAIPWTVYGLRSRMGTGPDEPTGPSGRYDRLRHGVFRRIVRTALRERHDTMRAKGCARMAVASTCVGAVGCIACAICVQMIHHRR